MHIVYHHIYIYTHATFIIHATMVPTFTKGILSYVRKSEAKGGSVALPLVKILDFMRNIGSATILE